MDSTQTKPSAEGSEDDWKELESYGARVRQASRAEGHPFITSLTEGSLSHQVATSILIIYPLAEPQEGFTRTDISVQVVLDNLSKRKARHIAAVNHGILCAKKALREAYRE